MNDTTPKAATRKMPRITILLPLAMLLAACSPAHMVKKDDKLNVATVQPQPGKAALVVARTTSLGGAVNFYTYLGKKAIGVTKGKGCIAKTDIEPGLQYLIARTESLETGKIAFEPDKVYYVQQSPRIGWMVARVSLTPLSQSMMVEEVGTDGCDYYVIDEKDPIEDLTEHEYKEAITDYEREITEGHHKEFTEYKGTALKK
jgi:hypothetical protein